MQFLKDMKMFSARNILLPNFVPINKLIQELISSLCPGCNDKYFIYTWCTAHIQHVHGVFDIFIFLTTTNPRISYAETVNWVCSVP